MANVQSLVDSDEVTDPQHAFLSEELRSWVESELFDTRPNFEPKQFQRLFIGQLPRVCEVKKDDETAGAKPQAFAFTHF